MNSPQCLVSSFFPVIHQEIKLGLVWVAVIKKSKGLAAELFSSLDWFPVRNVLKSYHVSSSELEGITARSWTVENKEWVQKAREIHSNVFLCMHSRVCKQQPLGPTGHAHLLIQSVCRNGLAIPKASRGSVVSLLGKDLFALQWSAGQESLCCL